MTEEKTGMELRDERRAKFKSDLEKALADPDNQRDHPRPWVCQMVIYDGAGAQFFDANGKPILGPDLIRDPDDAAQLLYSINSVK